MTVTGVHADFPLLENLSYGSLTLSGGGTADVSQVRNIDRSSLIVRDGVTLSVPLATQYRHSSTGNSQQRTLRAEGAGSVLDLGNVQNIVGGTHYNAKLDIEALAGGQIRLGAVLAINDPNSGDDRQRSIDVRADGADSVVDLSSLRRVIDIRGSSSSGDSIWSVMAAHNGGTIQADQLLSLQGTQLILDGTGTQSIDQLQGISGGALTVSGTDYVFPQLKQSSAAMSVTGVHADFPQLDNLSYGSLTLSGGGTADVSQVRNIDRSSLIVRDGVTLSVPLATQYRHSSNGNSQQRTLRAEGAGSVLDLGQVRNIVGGTHYNARIEIAALGGGHVNLSRVRSIDDPDGGDTRQRSVDILADGIDSQVDLAQLFSFVDRRGTSASGDGRWSTLIARNDGSVILGQLAITVGVQIEQPPQPQPATEPVPPVTVDPLPIPTVRSAYTAPVGGRVDWVGGSGDWSNPANWSTGVVPGPQMRL